LKKGWLSLEEFKNLLVAFKFDHLFEDSKGKKDETLTFEKIIKEFEFNLS